MNTVRNLDIDPNALTRRYSWGAAVTRRDDGRYTYAGSGNSYMGSASRATEIPVGHVIVLIAQTDEPGFARSTIWRTDEVMSYQTDDDIYVKAARVNETGKNHELVISACANGVTILGSGVYAPDDWDRILAMHNGGVLSYPWMAGGSYPSGVGYDLLAIHPQSRTAMWEVVA